MFFYLLSSITVVKSANDLKDIPNKVRDAMGIIVGVNLLTEGGKEYIEIDVPSYPVGISCNGVYHYRSGSTKQILTGPTLEAFLLRKQGATWDNSPMLEYTVNSGAIMIKFTGSEDRIIRANDKVNEVVNAHVNDLQKELSSYLI